ncbi:MAG TPA: MgtC/SapB family protein [Casimicrobiaceae bacterium]|nr:MgtC/SapB family protein [Casimicrobiaceae bacterium]
MNEWEVILRTIVALAAGGAIGLERTYHGRAAGLRTYALVSFGSALFVGVGQYVLVSARDSGEIARIVQGIVTGVGFLGAGVIVKEGFSVRGLTTAASIWVAAAIGVALGTGSYWTGLASTLVTLVALSILRRIEDRLPSQTFVHFEVAFRRASTMDEDRLREIIGRHGFRISEFAYRLDGSSQSLEYRGVILAHAPARLRDLERSLVALPDVLHFRMSPTRE